LAPRSYVARFLALQPLVWIGLLSYSWYLWHWPAMTFTRLANFGDHDLFRDSLVAIGSLALAALTYRFVELPFRDLRKRIDLRTRSWPIVFGGVASCIGVAAIAGVAGAIEVPALKKAFLPRLAANEDRSCTLMSGTIPPDC